MLVKKYMRGVNSFKKELAEKKWLVDLKTQESKRRSNIYLEIYSVFTTDIKKLTDDDVTDRRSNLFRQIKKLTNTGINKSSYWNGSWWYSKQLP